VDRALDALNGIVERGMKRTGVPGVAVAVVYKDQVVRLDGYGTRRVGQDAPVDADTVFQLASLSKPLASTVVAGAVGDLTLRLGPKPMTFRLTHYDGDTYYFETAGENATGPSGVTFKGDENGRATSVTIEAFDGSGLGTFRRS
jgi:hypothetical protein